MGYDANGNFINPGLVTQDIGTALAAQAFGTYNLGPTLSQDTINTLTGASAFSSLTSNPLLILGIGLAILFVVKKG